MPELAPHRATGPVVIMMDELPKEEWSTSEVARELGVSPSLVRTWIAYMNWEVRRNAEGHRIFSPEDVRQLVNLKAWLDEGNSLKEFRRERQGEGPYDPRLELRNAVRRLREMQSQEDALIAKQRELLDGYLVARQELQAKLETMRRDIEPEAGGARAPAAPEAPTAPTQPTTVLDEGAARQGGEEPHHVVQGVLKQLLTALMAKQGKLQLVGRHEEHGRAWLAYATPDGRKQVVEDLCTSDGDRQLLETVLGIIVNNR